MHLNYTVEAEGLRLTDQHGNSAGYIRRTTTPGGSKAWQVDLEIVAYEAPIYVSLDAAKYRALADFIEAEELYVRHRRREA